jgi:hypothetical protein
MEEDANGTTLPKGVEGKEGRSTKSKFGNSKGVYYCMLFRTLLLIIWSSSFVHKSSYRLQLSLLETSVSGTLLRTSYVSTGQRM